MAAAPYPGEDGNFWGAGLDVLAAAGEGLDEQPDLVEPAEGAVAEAEAPGEDPDPRLVAARSIVPGSTNPHIQDVKKWEPKASKPGHKHLVAAMEDRQLAEGERKPEPASWPVQKVANWLFTHRVYDV